MNTNIMCLIDTIMGYYIDPDSTVQMNLRNQGMNSEYAYTVGTYLYKQISESMCEDILGELEFRKNNLIQGSLSDMEFQCVKEGIIFAMNIVSLLLNTKENSNEETI